MIEGFSVALLLSTLKAGAVAAATATVEEVTKDLYGKLKASVGDVFGRGAKRSVEKLESGATRGEGFGELESSIKEIPPDDELELAERVQELLAALKNDPQAKEAVESAQIDLDFESGANILMQNIQNAQSIKVKAKAEGDITFSDVLMGDKGSSGN
jgi:hypothetical protein